MKNIYVERTALQGRLHIEPVVPGEDGGTGARWGATWAPSMDALPDIDAAAETLEGALVSLIYGLGEEILRLRREAVNSQSRSAGE